MKAAVFHDKHCIKVEEVTLREPLENEVVVKVKYCGVCGTDVNIYEGAEGSVKVIPPTILGHELSGDVVKIGNNVKKISIGDRVSVDPNDSCGTCYFCNKGEKHLCNEMIGIGTAADGGFAEYLIAKEHSIYKIGDDVSYENAAMIEPISCCLHGILLTDIKLGDTVMIVGTGNIGLIMVQLAKYMGAAKIIAVEPLEKRRALAEYYGAKILINPITDNTDQILEDNKIVNIDKVIDCAGLVCTEEYAIRYAGKGATVMLFGLTSPNDNLRIKPFELFKKELTIKASFVNPYTFEKAYRLLEAGIVNVDKIITDIIDLSDIETVFRDKLYCRNGKVLIKTW